jgi:hypothetical protein
MSLGQVENVTVNYGFTDGTLRLQTRNVLACRHLFDRPDDSTKLTIIAVLDRQ